MALDSTEVYVAGTGRVYAAPVGTAFPADITAGLAVGWVDLGYVSPEGARFNFGREVNEVMAWQSFDPIRLVVTSVPKEVSFDLLQWNQETAKLALGGGEFTEDSPGNMTYNPPAESEIDERQLIVAGEDGDNSYRFCFRRVVNMAGVEFAYVRENPAQLPITVKVLAPASGAKPYFVQTDDPAMSAAGS